MIKNLFLNVIFIYLDNLLNEQWKMYLNIYIGNIGTGTAADLESCILPMTAIAMCV